MRKTFPKHLLVYLLIGFLTFSNSPFLISIGATSVESNIIEDTVWTIANSPYEIRNDIKVNSSVTLTIEPGVVVSFDENATLIVEGSLIAAGNSSNRITFTSNLRNPTRGQWKSIRFVGAENDSFILKFAEVTYAENAVVIESSGKAVVENSELTNNSVSGLYAVGIVNLLVKNTVIRLNGNGITTGGNTSSGIQIVGNSIVSNDEDGIHISSSGADVCDIYNFTISYNYISGNGNGIYMFSDAGTENAEGQIHKVTISNNLISHNYYGIRLRTHGWYAGYIYNSTISDNTIRFNEEGINIYSGSNWFSYISDVTVSYNAIMANKNGISLYAFRTPEEPIEPVPFDSTIVSNIVSANNDTGISVTGDVRSNLTGNSVSYSSYGIYITSKDNMARKNDIYRNTFYGMYVRNVGAIKAQVNAEGNFWGASNGPFHQSLNSDGQGDKVNGDGDNLDFRPFLDSPLGIINQPPVARVEFYESEVAPNQTVAIDGLKSEDDLKVVSYFFDFGDGENSGWITAPITEHEYVSLGLYNVTLIVMDEFGVRSNNTAVETVTVAYPILVVSVFLRPIVVFSQEQTEVEVKVTNEKAASIEGVLVQLTSDKGGSFTPDSGHTDSEGDFNSTFHAPLVSESTGVEIIVSVSKEGYISSSENVILSVLQTSSNGTDESLNTSWVWPIATLATLTAISVAVVLVIAKRRKGRRPLARKKRRVKRNIAKAW